jgi:hypothetical protein
MNVENTSNQLSISFYINREDTTIMFEEITVKFPMGGKYSICGKKLSYETIR